MNKEAQKPVNSDLSKGNHFYFFVFLGIAFLLYGNTLFNEYCLDDAIVITQNSFTKQGASGIPDIFGKESFSGFFGTDKQLVSGGRYRPLSIASFALEYQVFGLNPHISHFINILLYALTGFCIFLVFLALYTPDKTAKWYLNRGFFIASLFLIHPVHTEVVANIKGRDEILALLFSLLTLWQALLYVKDRKPLRFIYIILFFTLALFSKESALTFLIIIPLVLSILRFAPFKQILKITGIILIPVGIFLIVRESVLGSIVSAPVLELLNNAYLGASPTEKSATIFYVLGKYIKLLFIPYPLTYDYYPYHIALVDWSHIYPLAALVIYISMVATGILFLRSHPFISTSILLYLLPLILVSNILFPIGTFMNERFLYMPSLGFCMLLGTLLYFGITFRRKTIPLVSGIFTSLIVIFFSLITITRNPVWKNDYTLFTTDVKVSGNSAKGNCAAGGIIFDTFKQSTDSTEKISKFREAIGYLKKAVSIHPTYVDAWLILGNVYSNFPDSIDKALQCYESILSFSPGNAKAIHNLKYISSLEKIPEKKIAILEKALRYEPSSYDLLYQLGNTWGKSLNDLTKAMDYLEKAHEVNPSGIEAMKDMGVVYGIQGNFEKSREILESAVKIDSTDSNVWNNLGVSYLKLNIPDKAQQCFTKAKSLHPN